MKYVSLAAHTVGYFSPLQLSGGLNIQLMLRGVASSYRFFVAIMHVYLKGAKTSTQSEELLH